MKNNENLEKIQYNLIQTLKNSKLDNSEKTIELLKEHGLDTDSATKLLTAFSSWNNARQISENTWNSAFNSKSGIDFSTDINKSQQREYESKSYLDDISFKCSLSIMTKTIEANDINEEFLELLSKEGISENTIDNPTLKLTYHYYNESKNKDEELKKVNSLNSKLESQITNLTIQMDEIKIKYNKLKTNLENLKDKFTTRIETNEKHYQAALSQIATLKTELTKSLNKGIFKTIGDKFSNLFDKKAKELPSSISEIPNTLYETPAEKMGLNVTEKDEFKDFELTKNDKDLNIPFGFRIPKDDDLSR